MQGPGGFGGGRGGGGGGRGWRGIWWGRGGGFRSFDPTTPHGSIYYQNSDNALNATPFSLTGAPTPKLGGSQNSFGVSFTGSPSIPGVVKASSKQFVFLSVTGQRNITPENLYGTVPTLLEREGDFAGLTQRAGGDDRAGDAVQPADRAADSGQQLCECGAGDLAAGDGAAELLSGAEYSDDGNAGV